MTIAQATAPRKRKRMSAGLDDRHCCGRLHCWPLAGLLRRAICGCGRRARQMLRRWQCPWLGRTRAFDALFYSFGHTSTAIFLQTASPKVVEQRLPFQLGVVPQQFRVRVENIDYLGDERLGDIEIQSVYLGHMTGEGEFETDVRLSGREETRNSKFVTDWFDQETMQLDTDEEYLLGISFSAPGEDAGRCCPRRRLDSTRYRERCARR
jgi:hypothetical protein